MFKLVARLKNRFHQGRSDRGAEFLEYAALFVVVGVIAAIIITAARGDEGWANTITTGVADMIDQAFDEANGDGGGGAPADDDADDDGPDVAEDCADALPGQAC